MKYLLVLRAVWIPSTQTTPECLRVYNHEFKEHVDLPKDKGLGTAGTFYNYLHEKGFNLIGYGTGDKCWYVITDTFKSIK